jgi:flagellar biogenesis protein FliO
MELLGRLPLDGRKAVYLARVGNKVYALLASEGGLTKLDEIDPEAIPPDRSQELPFAKLLAKAISRKADAPHDR